MSEEKNLNKLIIILIIWYQNEMDFSLLALLNKNYPINKKIIITNQIKILKEENYSKNPDRPEIIVDSAMFELETNKDKLINESIESIKLRYEKIDILLYDENIRIADKFNFLTDNLLILKSQIQSELIKKILIVQSIIPLLEKSDEKQIIFLTSDETNFENYKDNLIQNMLYSGFNMITTAIADEYIEKGFSCNGVIMNNEYVETLQWLLEQRNNAINGKLIKNKEVINW